ncbi:hypothetical protein EFW17_17540 [Halostreptopolyspora alba]|uniref:Uncharacterized protein n=1 Tax=Halostreptopolyspora alba TaxID=2487137 RepID=A0A3N0E5A0_9ACTN|nr:hypothetical protein EFW17_17540 [Nocardiopsaceae bacterium YIM 96095]
MQCGTPGSVSSMQSPTAQTREPLSHRESRTHHGSGGREPGEGKEVAAPMASTCDSAERDAMVMAGDGRVSLERFSREASGKFAMVSGDRV